MTWPLRDEPRWDPPTDSRLTAGGRGRLIVLRRAERLELASLANVAKHDHVEQALGSALGDRGQYEAATGANSYRPSSIRNDRNPVCRLTLKETHSALCRK